uniref:Transmembrane protein 144 n=1 Tax=Panagrolaimus sp. JU765 TaxID=591449 RepID=A0AC34QKN2_9BILA
MSAFVGLLACGVSSVFFGSMFVPIRKHNTGDGLFVQWVMCSAIVAIGMIVNAAKDFPQFQPLAMVGGFLWAVGNLTAVPIINMIGLGMGILVWGTVNCVVGWACGRFGLFGINPSVPDSPIVNYVGLILVVIGGFLFSQIRPSVSQAHDGPENDLDAQDAAENSHLIPNENEIDAEQQAGTEVVSRKAKRSLGIILSLLAGLFYGVTFVPVIYIQDHKEDFRNPPPEAISYAFSHYCGIYLTSTAAFLVYLVYKQNKPFVNSHSILPAFCSGLLWAVAQLSWFIANDALSQAITFPIISMVPGVIASLWSIFYFEEIRGRQNLRLLGIAIAITLTGAALVGVSKGSGK